MIIYFAHPIKTYFTQRERLMLGYIHTHYPEATVINPSKYYSEGKKFKFTFYLDRVLKADTFIFCGFGGRVIGKGIYEEVKFARKHKKTVYFLSDAGELVDNFTIFRLPKSDWQRYARVKIGDIHVGLVA